LELVVEELHLAEDVTTAAVEVVVAVVAGVEVEVAKEEVVDNNIDLEDLERPKAADGAKDRHIAGKVYSLDLSGTESAYYRGRSTSKSIPQSPTP
jgi:hypothetical protein